jgi:hypothetical protein
LTWDFFFHSFATEIIARFFERFSVSEKMRVALIR